MQVAPIKLMVESISELSCKITKWTMFGTDFCSIVPPSSERYFEISKTVIIKTAQITNFNNTFPLILDISSLTTFNFHIAELDKVFFHLKKRNKKLLKQAH